MAAPLPAALEPIVEPFDSPAGVSVGVGESGSTVGAYTGGSLEGSSLEYELVSDFAWWIAAAAGWTTRNRGGRRYTGSMHGLEDGARRRRE